MQEAESFQVDFRQAVLIGLKYLFSCLLFFILISFSVLRFSSVKLTLTFMEATDKELVDVL